MRALVLVLFAACGGSRPPSTEPISNQGSAAPTSDGLPAHFAGLFVAGEKTFPGELVTSRHDVNGPVTDKQPGEVVCLISDVRSIRGGKVAQVGCSGMELVDQIPGTFVGTAQGLWQVDGSFEDDLSQLEPGDALLGAVPTKARREEKGSDPQIETGSAIIVEPHAGGWCVLVTSWAAAEGGWQLCLKEGAGIIGGHGFLAGGQTRDVYFGSVRRR